VNKFIQLTMSVKQLKKTLTGLKRTCQEILRNMRPIMKKVENRDRELLLKGVMAKNFTQEEEGICTLLEERCTTLLRLPLTVLDEIDIFSDLIIIDEESLLIKSPFMYEVWTGDYFGESKINGLELLLNEIRAIESNLSEESILNSI
jgi:hypothetical protein